MRDSALMATTLSELRESLFLCSPNPAVIADSDRKILTVNKAFTKTFEYTEDEALGLHVSEIYADPQEFERTKAEVQAATDEDGGAIVFSRYIQKSGKIFPARASLMQLRSASGAPIGFAGVIQDLTQTLDLGSLRSGSTDIATAIERAAAEENFTKILYNRTPAMMHSIDTNGLICTVSDAWLKRLGFKREDVIGKSSTQFLTEESRDYAQEYVLPEFWKTGRCERVPYTFVAASGERVDVELSAALDTSSGEKHTLAILEDVTERNQAMRKLRLQNEQLRDFAQVAAHDLKAPLRHILLFSEEIEADLQNNEIARLREDVALIRRGARSLAEIVDTLLEFSTVGQNGLSPKTVSLNTLVEHCLEIHRQRIEESDAKITVQTLPSVFCDPALMQSVFSNVIENALKYVDQGIVPELEITSWTTPDRTEIAFCDNGIGIAPEFRERVFQPLKRLHGKDSGYSGHGIGLALCQRIVSAHDGTMHVEEAPTGGCRFVVNLPRIWAHIAGEAHEATYKFATRR